MQATDTLTGIFWGVKMHRGEILHATVLCLAWERNRANLNPFVLGSSQSQLSCCTIQVRQKATTTAQVPLVFKLQDRSAWLYDSVSCLSKTVQITKHLEVTSWWMMAGAVSKASHQPTHHGRSFWTAAVQIRSDSWCLHSKTRRSCPRSVWSSRRGRMEPVSSGRADMYEVTRAGAMTPFFFL